MEEISSFNMLFATASNKKCRLESFREDDVGFFYASWRTADNSIGPEIKRRSPFNAALDAFLAVKWDSPAAPTEPESGDLFG